METKSPILATARRTPRVAHVFAEVGERRLHLLDFGGEGRTTLLLHGVGGGAWTWHRIGPKLAADSRVLAPDLPGYGLSERAADGRYDTAGYAATLAALLEGEEAVDVVGFSWGGLIALQLAASAPALVRRAVVIDIGAAPGGSATNPPPFALDFASGDAATVAQTAVAPRAPAEVHELMAALMTQPAEGGGFTRALDRSFSARWPFRADDLTELLGDVRAPVLVVRAAESEILSREAADSLVTRLPDARLVTIPRSGHLVPLEQPELLAAAISYFLTPERQGAPDA